MARTVEPSFEHVPGPGAAERRAVFLHGILGSGANLRTLARRFLKARPGWDAWLVDLRGHGGSPKGTPGPSLAAVAGDVRELCAGSAVPVAAFVGHSFGGKVALEVVREGLGPALAHVVTLDSCPGTRAPAAEAGSALSVLEMLQALPATFPSTAAFVEAVVARGKTRPLGQWLAMSTEPAPGAPGAIRFALDLGEIRALLESYLAADLWPVVEAPPGALQVHLVIADRSTAYAPADRARARAIAAREPRVTVDVLPTDHWVHSEDPEGTLRVLLDRVPG